MTKSFEKINDSSFEESSISEIKEVLSSLLDEIKKKSDLDIEEISSLKNKIEDASTKSELKELYVQIENLRNKEKINTLELTKGSLDKLKKGIKNKKFEKELNVDTISEKSRKGRDLAKENTYNNVNKAISYYNKIPFVGKFIAYLLKKTL